MAKLNPASIHVRLPDDMLSSLREIAQKQRPPVEAAELLRRAAVAIIDCWEENRKLPADMVIRGRAVLVETVHEAISPMGYNLGRLPGDPPPEEPPTPRSKKTPKPGPSGAGPALPGSKPDRADEDATGS